MEHLIKFRETLIDDYNHAVDTGDQYCEADGLNRALVLITEQISQIEKEQL